MITEDEELHPILNLDCVTNNTYENPDAIDYLEKAIFLIENHYTVTSNDPTTLAEFLRKHDLAKKEKENEQPENIL